MVLKRMARGGTSGVQRQSGETSGKNGSHLGGDRTMRGFIASVKSLDVDGVHFSPSLLNRRRTVLFSIFSKQEKYQTLAI